MNNYTVYIHISPSDKRYIGITSRKPEYRWSNGKGYKNNKYFTNAINKHGWNNFQHIIIARGLSEEEAKWLEIQLIREWDSTNLNKGYNITLGGESGNGYMPSEERKRELSELFKGENNPNYGKHLSEETRKKLSEAHKGKIISEKTRKKMSESRKGKNHPQAKTAICITTGKIFHTTKEGAKYYNCSNHIPECCKGKIKSCGKLPDGTKLVWMYLEEFLDKCKYTIL